MSDEIDSLQRTTTARFSYVAIISALVVAEVMSTFESSMIYLAIPDLMVDFQAGVDEVSWAVTVFFLVSAVSAGIGGKLGDMYGRRKILLWLLAIATIGSIMSVFADNLLVLVIGRGLQGTSGAVLALAVALARRWTPAGSTRGTMGITAVAASATLGGVLGVVVAGAVLETTGWHAIFIVSGALGVIAFVAVAIVVPRDIPGEGVDNDRLDIVGAVLLAPAIALVLVGITNGESWGWSSSGVLTALAGGLGLLAIWTWWELRIEHPLIQLRDFTSRHLALTMAASISACGAIAMIPILNSMILQGPTDSPLGLGMSPATVGAITCVTSLISFAFFPALGRIAASRGAGQTLLIGTLLIGVVFVGYLVGHDSVIVMIGVMQLIAIGLLFTASSLPILVAESVPEERTGEITGATVVVRAAVTAIAAAIGVTVFASSTTPDLPYPDTTGLLRVIILLTIWSAPAVVASLMLRHRKGRGASITREKGQIGAYTTAASRGEE